MILNKPDDNTNVVKSIWSAEDKLEDNTSVVKSRWSTKDNLDDNTAWLSPDGHLKNMKISLTTRKSL